MAAASRLGDLSSGHGCFPPTAINSTPVSKTFINGIKAAVVDAGLVNHRCGKTTHFNRKVTSGSGKVFIEGKAACRISDSVSCGDTIGQGSSNTYFGG